MLNKTLIVLTVLLVGLMAISAVSAETDTAGDIVGTNDTAQAVDNVNEEENLDSSLDDDSSNGSECDTYKSNAANSVDDEDNIGAGDTETFAKEIHVKGNTFEDIDRQVAMANDGDILYLDGITYTGDRCISIVRSVTLVGQEGTVLDAQGKTQILKVEVDNVTIKNIKFINGEDDIIEGGAIYAGWVSNFELSNCTFVNNSAVYGGAVCWNGADGNITNCTFIGNSAYGSAYSQGGAIYVTGDNGIISNCVFIDNNAVEGKAIRAPASNSQVYDCYFKNIPFLDIIDEDSTLTLTLKANFDYHNTVVAYFSKKENLKYWNGSAYVIGEDPNLGTLQYPGKNVTLELYHSNGELAYTVSNLTDDNGQIVFDCTRFNDDRYIYRAYAYDDDFNFISASGRLNDHIGDFNILQNYINSVGENGTVNLTGDYTFTDGLDDNLKEGIIIPFNLTVYGNGHTISGEKSARIFNVTGSKVSIHGINIINGYSAGNGGAIYWKSSEITISNCSFENNFAKENGGANYFEKAVTNATLTGNFINNSAVYGGANCFGNAVSNVTLSGNFTGNSAERGSGGANFFNSKVSGSNVTGTYNHNTGNGQNYYDGGGANYFNDAVTNVNLTGTFNNNHAKSDGGANYFRNTVTKTTLTGNFTNNTVEWGSGGANIFLSSATKTTLIGNFNNNRATVGGGANSFWGSATNVTLTGNFTNNTVKFGSGGANRFYGTVTNVNLTGNFINNRVEGSGGANAFIVVSGLNVGGTYTNNTATVNGGANYFQSSVSSSNVGGTYTNNTAKENGSANCFISTVTDITLRGNYINNNGSNVIFIHESDSGNVIHDSIFINNTQIVVETGNVSVMDVWFGNNVTNYDVKPDAGIDLDNWLFLNATADVNPITLEDTTSIVFKLSRYNGENITEYDNSRLLPINLTVTSALGSANPNMTNLDESITYTPDTLGKGNVTALIENVFCTIEIENEKADPGLSMDSQEMTYNNNTVIALNFNASATGTVNITLKGNKYNKTYENLALNTTILLEGDILPDEYNITVTYSGDEAFKNASCNSTLKINKIDDYTMDINSTVPMAGENATVTVTLPSNAEGNVTVTDANGNNYTSPVEDGTAVVEVPNLPLGDNNITVTYSGDDRYDGNTAKSEVHVDKMATFLYAETFEMYQGDGTQYVVNLTDINGKPIKGMGIKVNITGKTYTIITDENGTAVLPINLKAGVHPATAFFNGKGDYANATPVSTDVNVLTKVRIDQHKDLIKDYGDSDKFTVHAVDKYGKSVGANAKVKMTIAGKTYTVFTDAQGYASLPINLKPGTYDITCEYAGYTVKHKVTVKQVLSATNRQYKKAASYQFTATLKHSNGKAISGKTVTFTFKGKTYTQTTNANGEATITIKETLNLGKYNIMIKYIDSAITRSITIK